MDESRTRLCGRRRRRRRDRDDAGQDRPRPEHRTRALFVAATWRPPGRRRRRSGRVRDPYCKVLGKEKIDFSEIVLFSIHTVRNLLRPNHIIRELIPKKRLSSKSNLKPIKIALIVELYLTLIIPETTQSLAQSSLFFWDSGLRCGRLRDRFD